MRGSYFCAFLAIVLPLSLSWVISTHMLHPAWRQAQSIKTGLLPPTEHTTLSWLKKVHNPKVDCGLEYEDIEFLKEPGFYLRGWFVPAKSDANTTIIMTHGAGSDRRAMTRYMPLFHELGFDVMSYDSSDMGISDSHERGISLGARESHDVQCAIDYVLSRKPNSKIVLYGASQGATASLLAAAADTNRISLVIAENPFADPGELLLDGLNRVLYTGRLTNTTADEYGIMGYFANLAPKIIPEWLKHIAVKIAVWRAGATDKYAKDLVDKVKCPVFYMQGTNDVITPDKHTRLLHERTVAPKELWLVEQGTHSQLYNFFAEEFVQRVRNFLNLHHFRK